MQVTTTVGDLLPILSAIQSCFKGEGRGSRKAIIGSSLRISATDANTWLSLPLNATLSGQSQQSFLFDPEALRKVLLYTDPDSCVSLFFSIERLSFKTPHAEGELLPPASPNDFPEIQDSEMSISAKIPYSWLKRFAKSAPNFAKRDGSYRVLEGVRVSLDSEKAQMFSSDGARALHLEVESECSKQAVCSVPMSAFLALEKLPVMSNGMIELRVGEKTACFRSQEGGEIVTRLIDGTLPSIGPLMRSPCGLSAAVQSAEVLRSLERIGGLRERRLAVEVGESEMRLSAKGATGTISGTAPCCTQFSTPKQSNEIFEVDGHFFSQAIKAAGSAEIVLELNSASRFIRVSARDNSSYASLTSLVVLFIAPSSSQ